MNSLKSKIIYYYIIITTALLACEGYLIYFLIKSAPHIIKATGINEIVLEISGIFICLAILFFVSYFYYSKVSKIVNQEAEKQMRERNMIFANISHDLKNPMSSVLGFARALEEGKVSEDEKAVVYRAICDKSAQMNDMVLKMFQYAKMESDGYALKCQNQDLSGILRGLLADRYNEIEKHNIELDIDIPEMPVIASVDSTEFSRVINNLITNAIKHNNVGVGLLVSLKDYEDKIKILIADTGNEIPKAQHDSIFQPFQCSDESRTAKDGSGLGLAISRRIAQLHNGKLYIDSSISGYTKAFVFEIAK
ncbi:MAG: HAMP domain-containing sensor histidine kinase [Ruminococcus sp.]|nr:HAMP domain-containing sensor histidine kinase [Ruminococcus sp.]